MIVAVGIAIVVVTTMIGKIITNSITEPVEQIEKAVASLRKGELSNVEMLTYESEDEFGDTIKNLKEAMTILADYVREISAEVKAIDVYKRQASVSKKMPDSYENHKSKEEFA